MSGFSPLPGIAANKWNIPSYPQFTAAALGATAAAATNTGLTLALTTTGAYFLQPLINVNNGVQTTGPVPDLTSVFCASKNLCFAAGGFMPLPSAGTATAITSPPTVGIATINTGSSVLASDLPSYGQILRSTNGGTYWSYTSLPLNYMPSSPVCTFNPNGNVLTNTAGGFSTPYWQDLATTLAGQSVCPVPGLLAIGATANGKIVVATGAPGLPTAFPGSLPSTNYYSTAGTATPSTVANFGTIPTPVILYSSNSGASYTVQQAPVHPGNFLYTLNAVVAIKSTLAFAAGGNPYGTQGHVGSTAVLAAATAPITASPFGTVALNAALTASATLPGFAAGAYAFQSPAQLAAGTTVTVVANALPVGVCTGVTSAALGTCTGAGTLIATAIAAQATSPAITVAAAGLYTATLTGTNVMATAPVVPAGGIVIASFNGGYTWAIQTISGTYTYSCTAANSFGLTYAATGLQTVNSASTAVTANVPGTAVSAAPLQVYGPCGYFTGNRVAAYSPQTTQAANTIPSINALGFTQMNSIYTGWAVGDSGLVLKTSVTATAISTIATSASGTVITSWVPQLIAGISSGSGFMNLYGIQWDNMNVGYIFGAGVIASTHNGGVTWQIETPNNLISGTTLAIQSAAIGACLVFIIRFRIW